MPNRYEREIEEILRNLEHTDPKSGHGKRFADRFRRRARPQMRTRQRSYFSFHFSTSERLLIFAIVAALLAGGYAFTVGAEIFTGIVAILGLICLFLVAFSQFLFQPRRPQSLRYGNVTVTPLRQNFFSGLWTRWHLLLLKLRYRRRNGR